MPIPTQGSRAMARISASEDRNAAPVQTVTGGASVAAVGGGATSDWGSVGLAGCRVVPGSVVPSPGDGTSARSQMSR